MERKVELAAKAGFCFGVERAMKLVYEQIEAGRRVYTYGPMIHNEAVIAELEEAGVTVIDQAEDITEPEGAVAVIRSHGAGEAVCRSFEATGAKVVDATCPYVKKIHRIVKEASEEGRQIIIAGDPAHPEVRGIAGWCGDQTPVILPSPAAAEDLALPAGTKVCLVSQTTNNYKKFKELVEIIREKGYDVIVHDTVCHATSERQEAAKELAERADAMIVIGGKDSSNTRKLYEICSENCRNTFFIQRAEDLKVTDFACFDYIGITAGASTPKNIIEEVQNYARRKF